MARPIPEFRDFREANRMLFGLMDLHVDLKCKRSTLARHLVDNPVGVPNYELSRVWAVCESAAFITCDASHVTLLSAGVQYLSLNPERTYETSVAQQRFLAEMFIEGCWKSGAISFFRSFRADHNLLTFKIAVNDIHPNNSALAITLEKLGIIKSDAATYVVTSEYVVGVRNLKRTQGRTQEALEEALEAQKELGLQAEHAVVEFERDRLNQMGKTWQAENVIRISHLEPDAGYDIRSFEGNSEEVKPNRFIEVKASADREVRFFLSNNQLNIAANLKDRYWIYFIPAFRLGMSFKPVLIKNPVERLSGDGFLISPVKYVVRGNENLQFEEVMNGRAVRV